MSPENVLQLLRQAVESTCTHDRYLLEEGAHEMAVVGRCSHFVHQLLTQHDEANEFGLVVDTEWNRDLGEVRRLAGGRRTTDLVVHCRGTHEFNWLAVEFKKWARRQNAIEHDRPALERLAQGPSQFMVVASVVYRPDGFIEAWLSSGGQPHVEEWKFLAQ